MVTVIPTNRLNWRSAAAGPSLHLDRRDTALLHVVKDKTYSNMWRIRSPDGSLSEMANLTRAKDAALHLALVILNRKPEAKEPAVAAPYSDYSALKGVRRHKPQITTPSSVAA